jgi:LmbE family N-acetylglucosaminyl deacetylase
MESTVQTWQPENLQDMSVLVVFAHPDDADFHFGGTIALMAAAGADISYLCATRGDKGDRSGKSDGAETASLRETEQRAAALELGITKIDFLSEKDGRVACTRELIETIARKIRAIRPEIVITLDVDMFDPSWGVNHRDHREIATATIDAVYPVARNKNFLPDTPPHVVRKLMVLSYENPTIHVDTSGAPFEQQLKAMKHHQSQWGANFERVLNKRLKLGMVEPYRVIEFD